MISTQPDPIDVIERTLRSVIDEVLSDRYGPNWTQDEDAGLGSAWSEALREKAREDQASTSTTAAAVCRPTEC